MAALLRPGNNQGSPTFYLLFAGRHGKPATGVGSLVGAFTSPEDARDAFRQTRLRLSDQEGWAELTAVAEGTRPRIVSWFGQQRPRHSELASTWLAGPDRLPAPATRRPLPFRPFVRRLRRQDA